MENITWSNVKTICKILIPVSFFALGFFESQAMTDACCYVFFGSIIMYFVSRPKAKKEKALEEQGIVKQIGEAKIAENLSEGAQAELRQIEEKYNISDFDTKIESLEKLQNELNEELSKLTETKNSLENNIKLFEADAFSNIHDLHIDHVNKVFTIKGQKVNFDEVLNVEITCNSHTVSTTNSKATTTGGTTTVTKGKAKRSVVGTAARAAVGGALLGPAGMVIGAASSPKKIKTTSVSSNNISNNLTSTTTDKVVNYYFVIVETSQIESSTISIYCGEDLVKAKNISNGILNSINYPKQIDPERVKAYKDDSSLNAETTGKIEDLNVRVKEIISELTKTRKERKKAVSRKNSEIRSLNRKIKKGLI